MKYNIEVSCNGMLGYRVALLKVDGVVWSGSKEEAYAKAEQYRQNMNSGPRTYGAQFDARVVVAI